MASPELRKLVAWVQVAELQSEALFSCWTIQDAKGAQILGNPLLSSDYQHNGTTFRKWHRLQLQTREERLLSLQNTFPQIQLPMHNHHSF